MDDLPSVDTLYNVNMAEIDMADMMAKGRPLLLKGAMADKPIVQAAMQSRAESMQYLKRYHAGGDSDPMGRKLLAYVVDADQKGCFHYNENMTTMNFRSEYFTLNDFFDAINEAATQSNPPSFYIGSTDVNSYFPALIDADTLLDINPIFQKYTPMVGIWMGNRTVASAHFDMSNNVAACVAGKRRFTLFPPDQIANLYPGPLSPTPGGQIVSTVDFENPDFDRHANFANALKTAQVADMEAGDVLIYPALWWHRVEALDDFNILINYWWNETAMHLDDPMNTLLHAMMSLRERPSYEKSAWRAIFEYYIFGDAQNNIQHLPPQAHGPLGTLNHNEMRRMRGMLLQKLNR